MNTVKYFQQKCIQHKTILILPVKTFSELLHIVQIQQYNNDRNFLSLSLIRQNIETITFEKLVKILPPFANNMGHLSHQTKKI